MSERLGGSAKTVDGWRSSGLAASKVDGKLEYDIVEVAKWLAEHRRKRTVSVSSEEEKAILQYRQERVKLLRVRRLQLTREWVPVEKVREQLLMATNLIRKGVERFHKAFGNDAVTMLNNLIDEVQSELGRLEVEPTNGRTKSKGKSA